MKLKKAQRLFLSSSLSVFLVGCGAPNYSPSESHITVEEVSSQAPIVEKDNIPSLVKTSPTAPAFSGKKGSGTYDVVVTGVPVRDLLFALARDSGVNMDVSDDVSGLVTMSALDQTLDAILARIARQIDIRVETVGDAIIVKADTPYYKQYHIDFLNITRTYTSSATTSGVGGGGAANISNAAVSNFWSGLEDTLEIILEVNADEPDDSGSAATLSEEDDRRTRAENVTDAQFRLYGENNYSLSQETGVLVVYAPDRLQREVQSVLDNILSIAKRQVLLEATVVEVVLNNQYAQGIDWSVFNSMASEGLALYQGASGGAASAVKLITQALEVTTDTRTFTQGANETDAAFEGRVADHVKTLRKHEFQGPNDVLTSFSPEVEYTTEGGTRKAEVSATLEGKKVNQSSTSAVAGGLAPTNPMDGLFSAAYRKGDISAAVQLLDTFGDARVLSSPRISALNYQPALLRVVDQEVYFNIETTDEVDKETGQVTSRQYGVSENTVDVGFAMNVLPHISEDGQIILNLKPSVTRILDYRSVPTPKDFSIATTSTNRVPITRIRELESVIALRDGEVAVLGGLLEDRRMDNNSSVPGISRLPGVGALFEKKNEKTYKTEFVVFIRARIIKNPSINGGDYSHYRHLLPDTDFILRETDRTLLPPAQQGVR